MYLKNHLYLQKVGKMWRRKFYNPALKSLNSLSKAKLILRVESLPTISQAKIRIYHLKQGFHQILLMIKDPLQKMTKRKCPKELVTQLTRVLEFKSIPFLPRGLQLPFKDNRKVRDTSFLLQGTNIRLEGILQVNMEKAHHLSILCNRILLTSSFLISNNEDL